MNKVYLLTRPEHDDTTYYLSNWCKETIKLSEERGIKVLDLTKEKANRLEFENRMNNFSPDLVVLHGHGNEDMVTGHKNQPLVVINENENLLNSKIVYAISCRSAKNLGRKSIEAGAINYSGYEDDFIFIYEPDKISRPLTDETAKLFLEHSKIFIESLIKGNSVGESFERSKRILKSNFIKALSEKNAPAARYLWWDLKNFSSQGNLNAKFT